MAFRTVDEFLALTGDDRPTPAEMRLVAAVRAGVECVISRAVPDTSTRENTVRASLLRLLITGATPVCGTQDFGVWLEGAWITGALDLRFAKARGRTTLRACHFAKTPQLEEANLNELSMDGSDLPGLSAQRMRVAGSLFLRQVTVSTTVDLTGARIAGRLALDRAGLSGSVRYGPEQDGHEPDGRRWDALSAGLVKSEQGLSMRWVKAKGRISLNGSRIGGPMECEGAEFDGAGGEALNARRLHVEQDLIWWEVKVRAGKVDLMAAHVGDLRDDGKWPDREGRLRLDGFTYDRISGDQAPVTAAARQGWLRVGSVWKDRFAPQPYTQLARVFRNMGHGGEARTVLYWREGLLAAQVRRDLRAAPVRTRRFGLGRVGRRVLAAGHWVAELLWWGVAGYGYRPFRTLGCLFALWLAAFVIADQVWRNGQFAPNSDVVLTSAGWQAALAGDQFPLASEKVHGVWDPNPAQTWSNDPQRGMDWESFSAWGYALDLVVPILDLGQTDAWAPSKDRGSWGWGLWWGRWWFEAFGWLVTALGAAAVTGIMQRERE